MLAGSAIEITQSSCAIELISWEMFAIVWAIVGCSIVTGIIAFNEGKRS